jgi:hypothetical protein
MSPAALVALEIALLVITGLVVGRHPIRVVTVVVLALACVSIPLALPVRPAWPRFVLGLVSLLAVLRSIEILRDARSHRAALRVFAFVMPVDALATRRAAPRIDARGLGFALGMGALATIGFEIVAHAPRGIAHWPVAVVAATVGVYTASDATSALVIAGLRAVGIEAPTIQRSPIRARSVAEFWGKRWNRSVGSWLAKHCFLPLARRGHVMLGTLAAFTVSAAIHFWPVLVAVGWWPAVAMGSFFMLQAVLVWIEQAIGVARWAPVPAHAWTAGVLLVSSPLFVVPILIVLGFD